MPLFLAKYVRCLNKIRLKGGHNLISTKSYLLEEFLDDDKDHFLVIEKKEKIEAMGLYAGMIFSDSGKTEIAVYFFPEYIKFYDFLIDKSNKKYFVACKTIYTMLEDSVVVREYDIKELERLYKKIIDKEKMRES